MLLWLEVLIWGGGRGDNGSCFSELETWGEYFSESHSTSCLQWMLWLNWKAGSPYLFGYRLFINQLQAWQRICLYLCV